MERDSMSLYLRFLGIVRISASFLRLAEYYVNGIINIIICTLSLCFIKINHIVSLDEFIDCFVICITLTPFYVNTKNEYLTTGSPIVLLY